MSLLETLVLGSAIGGAVFYLARRAWLRFGGGGTGCCGKCPVNPEKIRLAAEAARDSIGDR